MSKHFNKIILYSLPAVLLCPIAYATNAHHVNNDRVTLEMPSSYWFAGLETTGVFLSPKGNHPNRKFTNLTANLGTFDVTSGSTGMNVGAFIGYAIQNHRHWFSGYRVNIEGTQTVITPNVKGKWEYTLHKPANNYLYSYNLSIQTLGANVGIDVYRWPHFAIFLQAGTGVDWLTTKDFQATPLMGAENITFRFSGAKKSNMYYQGKIGVRYTSHHMSIGLAYAYTNLGKANTGKGRTDPGAVAASLDDRVKTNNVQLAMMYNF